MLPTGITMPYTSGEIPEVGDRISDKSGRVDTVKRVNVGPRSPTELTVSWDDGIAGIRYPVAEDFTLISRVPET
ncbi:MAG: hypothetical protein ACRDHZ_16190 [Ktedonobacteraceae bacterium]